jgi:hypothetical protein
VNQPKRHGSAALQNLTEDEPASSFDSAFSRTFHAPIALSGKCRRLPVSSKKAIKTVASVLLATASLAYLYFGDTWVAQLRHMKQARRHLPTVTQAVYAKPEFSEVTVGVGTAAGGCLLVIGRVASQSDLETLRQCISNTQPPVAVTMAVAVTNERYP